MSTDGNWLADMLPPKFLGASTNVVIEPKRERVSPPRCSDFDDDCACVQNKVACYLYDPIRGYCPFLRSTPR